MTYTNPLFIVIGICELSVVCGIKLTKKCDNQYILQNSISLSQMQQLIHISKFQYSLLLKYDAQVICYSAFSYTDTSGNRIGYLNT